MPRTQSLWSCHETPEEHLQRHMDKVVNMNPPDDTPFKNLACAVIFEAAKSWRKGADNITAKKFFESEDYLLWAFLAGLRVDGATMLHTLEENGGILGKEVRLLVD